MALTRCRPVPPLEISLPSPEEETGSILISGAVTSPGLYPYTGRDTIPALLAAAGGTTTDNASLRLVVSGGRETEGPQLVDINRAEAWLLEALPGIGPTRAAAIVEYRSRHGPFRSIDDLASVPGIGPSVLEAIRELVTVGE